VTVKAVSRSFATTTVQVRAVGALGNAVSIGDSLILIAEYSNPCRRNIEVSWGLVGSARPLRARPDTSRAGADTLRWKAGAAGIARFSVSVLDDGGSLWPADVPIQVLQDPPRADAGRDTTVSIGDEIQLAGMDSDAFGRIDSRAWEVEGFGSFRTVDGRTRIRVPMVPGRLQCVYRVEDDDGNYGYDTLFATIVADSPAARAGSDTMVSLGERIDLHGAGTDVYGKVLLYEWDIGGAGHFGATGSDTSFSAPKVPGVFPCILRVTDDDGLSGFDTLFITVYSDPPQAIATGDTTVSIGDRVRLRAFASDRQGPVASLAWDIGAKGVFSLAGGDTVITAPRIAGTRLPCILRAMDAAGEAGYDTVYVDVISDPPSAYAGRDTVVSVGDSVRLAGGASDVFGSIVKWEWKVGHGPFAEIGRNAMIGVPDSVSNGIPVILRVTDDDGLTGSDTLLIDVVADPPKALISHAGANDVFTLDTIELSCAASSDRFGKIVNCEWDTANGSASGISAGTSITVIMPGQGGRDKSVRLRVTDDDGMTGVDSIRFHVHPRGGVNWIHAPNPPAGLTRSMASALVYHDKIWVMGGNRPLGVESAQDVWSSSDGLAWTRLSPPSEIFPISAAIVHQDKMWIFHAGTAGTEVWSSTDGQAWTKIAAIPFKRRDEYAVAGFNGKMWLIGGMISPESPGPTNEVWSSVNGRDWVLESGSPGFRHRAMPGCMAFGGKLWVFGGYDLESGNHMSYLNDAWSSIDGKIWKQEADLPLSLGRFNVQLLEYNGRIWLLGGRDDGGALSDVWSSPDGSVWAQESGNALEPAGSFLAPVVFKGMMWVFGGMGRPSGFDNYPYENVRYSK
jgi:hypothetical protein